MVLLLETCMGLSPVAALLICARSWQPGLAGGGSRSTLQRRAPCVAHKNCCKTLNMLHNFPSNRFRSKELCSRCDSGRLTTSPIRARPDGGTFRSAPADDPAGRQNRLPVPDDCIMTVSRRSGSRRRAGSWQAYRARRSARSGSVASRKAICGKRRCRVHDGLMPCIE